MIELDSCPICNSHNLKTLLSTHIKYDDSHRPHKTVILNHILKNVLQKEGVLIHTKKCRQCKLMFLSPTFSPQELAVLYSVNSNTMMEQSHKQVEENSGVSYYEEFSGNEMIGKTYFEESRMFRRKFIYDVVTSFKKEPINKLLDIGGGDGSNILAFEKSKKFVYDLVAVSSEQSQFEFINDLDIAHSLAPFDLLVSTHTLEHIVNLRETVSSYARLVKPGSLFYVEVPLEYARIFTKYLLFPLLKKRMIIRGLSTSWHVNYFSQSPLLSLFAGLGYKILYLHTQLMPYGNLRMQAIIGLFEYTGISNNNFSSNVRWYRDYFNSMLTDIRIVGFRKLFKRYPSLIPFTKA